MRSSSTPPIWVSPPKPSMPFGIAVIAKAKLVFDPINLALPNAVDAAGRLLQFNSTYGLVTQRKESYDNKSLAVYSNLRWEGSDDFSVNAGWRVSRETCNTHAGSAILADSFAGELSPAKVDNGFANDASGNLAAGKTPRSWHWWAWSRRSTSVWPAIPV